MSLLVADIACPLILGLPWLRLHNPHVNWRHMLVMFSDGNCLSTNHVPTETFNTLPYSPPDDPLVKDLEVSTTSVSIPTENPPANSTLDIELLNTTAFFGIAKKHGLTIFATRMDVTSSPDDNMPTVSISAVINTKDYQESAIVTDDRGVPLRYKLYSDVFAP
ncbi:UNVERIFIED_CONTAM: hypothetical protein HDU68_000108, partial [Siphonaria sp. JEL0065]